MADPFSIIAGTIGVVDVAVRLIRFIDKTKKGADSVDGDLQDLVTEIENLKYTSEVIHDAFEKDMKEGNTTKDNPTAGTWLAASNALADCNVALSGMDNALVKMMGENGSSRFDRLRRHFRRLAQDEEFGHLRQRLDKGHHRLQTLLLTLNMSVCPFPRTRYNANTYKPCGTPVKRRSLRTDGKPGTTNPITRRQCP
jgi:hypothetical protein